MDQRIKAKISKSTLKKLERILDKRPYGITKLQVILDIDITMPTYNTLIKTGYCRSDVLNKINKYLENNINGLSK